MENKNHHSNDTKKKVNEKDEDPKTELEWRELMGEFKDRFEKRGGSYRKSGKRKL
jgi:hypothetical protein